MPKKPFIRLRFVVLFALIVSLGLGAFGVWRYPNCQHEAADAA
nr:hypothetical protein [uncultured Albidiferax sp.]